MTALVCFPLAIALASAQDLGVDAQRVRTLDGGPWPLLLDPDLGRAWEPRVALSFDYARDLVEIVSPDGERMLLSSVLTTEVGASIRLGDAVRIGVGAPIHGSVVFDGQMQGSHAGDFSIWATIPLVERPAGPALAWTVRADLPTGWPEVYLGDPHGALHGLFAGSAKVGSWQGLANLGVKLALPSELPGIAWGSRVEAGVGLQHGLFAGTWASVELSADKGLLREASPSDLPIEAMLAFGGLLTHGWGLTLGAGGGLTTGLGSPSVRVLLQVDARERALIDTDADGLADRSDRCPADPEDADGVVDLDGCPEVDADSDQLPDDSDACPENAETANGWQDADGCPDLVSTVAVSVVSADPTVPLEAVQLTIDDDEPIRVLGGDRVDLVRGPGELRLAATAAGFVPGSRQLNLPPGPVLPEVLALEPVRYGTAHLRFESADHRPVEGWIRGADGNMLVGAGGLDVRQATGAHTATAGAAGYRPRTFTYDIARDVGVDVVVELAPSDLRIDGSRVTTTQEIRFRLDSAELETEGEAGAPLAELLTLLTRDDLVQLLRIEGHADERGSSAYNLELSRRRAEAVRAWLIAAGVAPERLEGIGSGESRRAKEPAERAVTFTVLVWREP